jgi:hypothetical protein
MRVLHLLDVRSLRGGPCTQRLIADVITRLRSEHSAKWRHDVLIIGRGLDVRDSTLCGLDALGAIWPCRGRTLSATRAMRRWLEHARRGGSAPDLVHAWTATAGALAAIAAPRIPRVITTRPAAVDPDSPAFLSRQQVRARWAREGVVHDDEFVLGVLGEPAERFDARRAMHVGARTSLSGRRIRMLMSGRSLGRAAAQRFLGLIDLERAVVQDDAIERPWEIARGLDAALLLAPTSPLNVAEFSSMPLLYAWAAGVPVIAEIDAPLDGLLEDGCNGLIFPPDDFNAACDFLRRLYDDRTEARRLGDAGRELVTRRFATAQFCTQLVDGYLRALNGRAGARSAVPARREDAALAYNQNA